MSWKIKQKPGDFVVREELEDETEASWRDKIRMLHGKKASGNDGEFIWLTMTKTDTEFFKAIDSIAKGLGKSTKDISYSGTKDKRAVTSQTISVHGVKEKDLAGLKIKGIELGGFHRRKRHVRLGEHHGNRFTITVRNIRESEIKGAKQRLERIKKEGFVNFFGEQRFGSVRKSNHIIGKRLVRGGIMGSLGSMPLRKQKLFIHAYQALIWNRTASEVASDPGRSRGNIEIPIVGYKTVLSRYPETEGIIREVLKLEEVSISDFRVKEYPQLSAAGSVRELIACPKGLTYEFGPDETKKGMMKVVLDFWLGNGCYATELVRQISLGDIPGISPKKSANKFNKYPREFYLWPEKRGSR